MDLNYLKTMKRFRINDNRDFENGLLLNRGERVEIWNKEIISKIYSNIDTIEYGKYSMDWFPKV